MAENLPFGLENIAKSVSGIRLKGGLAGKICHVLIFSTIAIAAIAWSVKTLLVSLVALGMVFVLILVFLWRLIDLASRNPQSALMEGAEFLLHEQLMLASKNEPASPVSEGEVVVSAILQLSPAERGSLDEPEEDEDEPAMPALTGSESEVDE